MVLTKEQLEDMETCMLENHANCHECACGMLEGCQKALLHTCIKLMSEVEKCEKNL